MIFTVSGNNFKQDVSILSNNPLGQIYVCKMLKKFYHFSFPFTCILIQVCLCPYADVMDVQRQLKRG